MTPAIDLHRFPLRQRESAKIVRRHGEAEQKVDGWGLLRTSPTYLSRLSATVAPLTQANHFGQHRPPAARASRPAFVIRAFATAISFPPARIFSAVRVASPRLTSPAIKLASKPWALSSACGAPLRSAVASIARARRCSAPKRCSIIGGHSYKRCRARPLTAGTMRTNNERLACETGSRRAWRRLSTLPLSRRFASAFDALKAGRGIGVRDCRSVSRPLMSGCREGGWRSGLCMKWPAAEPAGSTGLPLHSSLQGSLHERRVACYGA